MSGASGAWMPAGSAALRTRLRRRSLERDLAALFQLDLLGRASQRLVHRAGDLAARGRRGRLGFARRRGVLVVQLVVEAELVERVVRSRQRGRFSRGHLDDVVFQQLFRLLVGELGNRNYAGDVVFVIERTLRRHGHERDRLFLEHVVVRRPGRHGRERIFEQQIVDGGIERRAGGLARELRHVRPARARAGAAAPTRKTSLRP